MTAGTPAPQDAETVDEVIRMHRLRVIGRVYDVCSCDWYGPDHGRHVLAVLAPVRAREVEAARREALEQAADEVWREMRWQAELVHRGDLHDRREAFIARLDVVRLCLAATHADDEQHDTKEDDHG